MAKWLLFLVLLFAAGFWLWPREIRHPPVIIAPDEPRQTGVVHPGVWQFKGYTLSPMAEFSLKARVLHAASYSRDREAELAPVDLALGWGVMSDQALLDQMSVSQSGRWYYCTWNGHLPVDKDEIMTHSGNMHMIPADPEVESRLRQLRAGNVVELRGELVNITGKDGWRWQSSLSRSDTGAGSCEVVWVKSLSFK